MNNMKEQTQIHGEWNDDPSTAPGCSNLSFFLQSVRLGRSSWIIACATVLLAWAFAMSAATPETAISKMSAANLRSEYAVNPLGIDVRQPRLSWILNSPVRGARQTAYQVVVSSSLDSLNANRADLWDSGKVVSDQSIQVVYSGRPLVARQQCFWKVRVWDQDGSLTAFSAPAFWEMGLIESAAWKAQWIAYPPEAPNQTNVPPSYLRKTVALWKPVKQARLYATALGLYEFHVNGHRVARDIFTPGWTEYKKRVQYQTYDITPLLQHGANAFGMILADGWYSGYVGLTGRNVYGKQPQGLCQIEIEYTDGRVETIVSDASWKASTGPLLQGDLLMGETYDARLEIPGWDTVACAESAWKPVLVTTPAVSLVASCDAPVRATQELKPISVKEPIVGHFVFDLGQNMVGWVRLKTQGLRGSQVTLRFAEILNPDGTLYTTNLRGAKATDHYILKGGGPETYEPRFTFHGFRYVELTGFPGVPAADAITGVVIHSDTPPSGHFACSNPMLNRLQSNINWGQRGNFVSIPTDCPQRDERLGWMGDAQIFVGTATFNMDVASFFTKWTVDVDDAQKPDGAFADVSPYVAVGAGVAAWGDAGVICPWVIYERYGDMRILESHYAAGAKWIDYLTSHSKDLLRPAEGYGDWLSIQADTPKDVLATAYFALSTRIMGKMAVVLGKTDDAKKYEGLFARIKEAFNKAYVSPDGRIKGNTQTCYVLALDFDLLPQDKRAAAAKYLVEDIAAKNGHLSTGFVGVGHLMPTLTQAGYLGVAYRLLNNDTFPSWLYSVRQGATTIWERWDGWTKEKGFQDPGMNSFNHYSLGSVGDWMYSTIAGIGVDPKMPAYKNIIIRAQPGGGITAAHGDYMSMHGLITSDWKVAKGVFTLDLTIPANTTAQVYIPTTLRNQVREGFGAAEKANGVKYLRLEEGCCVYAIGSGTYQFSAPILE
jgi:alpha-L-rhamnosidase